jgi:hypothetical protein
MTADEFVNLALERTKARVRSNDLFTGLLRLLALLAAGLLAAILFDLIWPLGRAAHLALLALVAVLAAASLAAILLWPMLRRVNDLFAARLIERAAEDQFRNSLLTFVELRHDSAASAEVRAAVAAKAAHDLQAVDLPLLLNRRPRRWALITLAAVALIVAALALAGPGNFTAALGRAVGMDIAPPPATRIVDLRPAGGATVPAGSDVRIVAELAGRRPETVAVTLNEGGRLWNTVAMKPLGGSDWELVVGNVRENLRFRVQAGDAVSDDRLITVRPTDAVTPSPSSPEQSRRAGEGGTSVPGEGLRPGTAPLPSRAAPSPNPAPAGLTPDDRAAMNQFELALEKTKGSPTGPAGGSPAEPSNNKVKPNPPPRGPGSPSAAHDAAAIQALGPQVKQLAQALQQAPPDPALLAELGWTEEQLRDFLVNWDHRFGPFAGGESTAPPTTAARPAAAPLLTATGSGSTGAGTTVTPRGPADAVQENIEGQKRRISPQFAALVEAYLRQASETETSR